tara:strand:- start:1343 stop:2170 length:828 start_codon:yes stop_codon:yes gene_type:complete
MNINEILSLILLIIVLSVFYNTFKNNKIESFLQDCGSSFSRATDNCGRMHERKGGNKNRCESKWQLAVHTGGKGHLKCVWENGKCKTGDVCSTASAQANDAQAAEQARLADEARIAQEKIDAKNVACGPIDTPQYDTSNWSYGGVIQGDCENYIDPEIEEQNKENEKNRICGSANITQYITPNWSYGGVIQGDCENYIDPEIEEQNKENEKNRICGSTNSQSNTKEWSYKGVIQGICDNYSEPISNPKQSEPINYSTQHLRISPTHVFVTNSNVQ